MSCIHGCSQIFPLILILRTELKGLPAPVLQVHSPSEGKEGSWKIYHTQPGDDLFKNLPCFSFPKNICLIHVILFDRACMLIYAVAGD